MADKFEDPAMTNLKARFEKSGMTLQELGLKMGYDPDIARQSAFQFLKSGDPRISMLRKFATAMGMKLKDLI